VRATIVALTREFCRLCTYSVGPPLGHGDLPDVARRRRSRREATSHEQLRPTCVVRKVLLREGFVRRRRAARPHYRGA
jgi:hypothetical protein